MKFLHMLIYMNKYYKKFSKSYEFVLIVLKVSWTDLGENLSVMIIFLLN